MILCARRDHVNRARNAARTLCERFVYSKVKITRPYDYQTWRTYLFEKVYGLVTSVTERFGCLLAGQTISDHIGYFPRDRSSSAPPISTRKARPRKKAHKPLRTSCISQTSASAMFDNHKILLFWLQNKKNLSHTLTAWSAFRDLFTWSWRTTCSKDHGLFLS